MDKKFIEDMIADLERIKQVVEGRLRELYRMVSLPATEDRRSDLRIEIERQRTAIVEQAERIKAQAMAQAAAARQGAMMGGLPFASGLSQSGFGNQEGSK